MFEIDKESIKKYLINECKFIRDRTIGCVHSRYSFNHSTSITPNSRFYLEFRKIPAVGHDIPNLFEDRSFINLNSWDIKVVKFNDLELVLNNNKGAANKRYLTGKERIPHKNYNDIFIDYDKEGDIKVLNDWVDKNPIHILKWID